MHRPFPRFCSGVLARLVAVATLASPLALQAPAAFAQDAVSTAAAPTARVIVKLKTDSSLRRMRIQSVGDRQTQQAQALGERVGLALGAGSSLDERTQVMTASGVTSAQLAARLSAESDIEWAVVDQRRRKTAVPNDPLYTTASAAGPTVGQWYLRPPDATLVSAINAQSAWDLTVGSSAVVVAVLDTGVRFDHVDLQPVASGGNLLPGYDFITDTATANDGDGRDADPSDPGDWITTAENASGPFKDCGAENSSWHGTQVASLIGAITNNGIGMASVGRTLRVLPVRVLGKCGGYDSDIIAGMRWAAGLDVPGVPTNTTPARVLNLSLGSGTTCGSAYAEAVSAINARGAVVVVSAGNESGQAIDAPGNCPGAISVTGVRHAGTKVGFANLGPDVTLAAPGGNCVNTGSGSACLYPILTALNSGTTTPVVGGSTYSDSFNYSLGTSFSSPLVAATAGLMLSVRPSLTAADVKARLQSTARPFPTTGGTAGTLQCVAPTVGVDQSECYCTTSTCGAGMLDVRAAVASVGGVTAQIVASATTAVAGQTITLNASSTQVSAGRSIASYQWTIVSGNGAAISGPANTASVVLTTNSLTNAASTTVQLTVVDNLGSSSTTTQSLAWTAVVVATGGGDTGGGGGGGALGLGWLVALALAAVGVSATRSR